MWQTVRPRVRRAATATFVDAPTVDRVNGSAVSAIYHRTAEHRLWMTVDCSPRRWPLDNDVGFGGGTIFTFSSVRKKR